MKNLLLAALLLPLFAVPMLADGYGVGDKATDFRLAFRSLLTPEQTSQLLAQGVGGGPGGNWGGGPGGGRSGCPASGQGMGPGFGPRGCR